MPIAEVCALKYRMTDLSSMRLVVDLFWYHVYAHCSEQLHFDHEFTTSPRFQTVARKRLFRDLYKHDYVFV